MQCRFGNASLSLCLRPTTGTAGKPAEALPGCIHPHITPVLHCLVIDHVDHVDRKGEILFQFNKHFVNRADLAV